MKFYNQTLNKTVAVLCAGKLLKLWPNQNFWVRIK